jgi:hypothetical protein
MEAVNCTEIQVNFRFYLLPPSCLTYSYTLKTETVCYLRRHIPEDCLIVTVVTTSNPSSSVQDFTREPPRAVVPS